MANPPLLVPINEDDKTPMRTRRHEQVVASILNSLIRTNIIVQQPGPNPWTIPELKRTRPVFFEGAECCDDWTPGPPGRDGARGAPGQIVYMEAEAGEDGMSIPGPPGATTGGSGTPGGSDKQVQFNDSMAFGGAAGFTFDKTTGNFTVQLVSGDSGYAGNFANNAATVTVSLATGSQAAYMTDGTQAVSLCTGADAINASGPVYFAGPSSFVEFNRSGYTLHASNGDSYLETTLRVKSNVGFFDIAPVAQQAANTALTDSTTGTPSATVNDVTTLGIADPTKINDNFASVLQRLAEIRTLLTNYGLGT